MDRIARGSLGARSRKWAVTSAKAGRAQSKRPLRPPKGDKLGPLNLAPKVLFLTKCSIPPKTTQASLCRRFSQSRHLMNHSLAVQHLGCKVKVPEEDFEKRKGWKEKEEDRMTHHQGKKRGFLQQGGDRQKTRQKKTTLNRTFR